MILITLVALLGGCTSVHESFTGHDPDQVWTAMVAAAQTPDYTNEEDYTQRWTVRENQVWVDEPNNRIEIYRKLERDLYRPAAHHLHEDREWKLQVALEDRDPPTIRFSSRQIGVPAHTWDEAKRYFGEVRHILESGVPPAPEAPSVVSVVPTTQPDQKPIIDIQSLEPIKP